MRKISSKAVQGYMNRVAAVCMVGRQEEGESVFPILKLNALTKISARAKASRLVFPRRECKKGTLTVCRFIAQYVKVSSVVLPGASQLIVYCAFFRMDLFINSREKEQNQHHSDVYR